MKVLINKGILEGECRFVGIFFICFFLIYDYNCNFYDDVNDYGFGIIVWFYLGMFLFNDIYMCVFV